MNEPTPRNFSWLMPGRVAALGFPEGPAELQFLVDHGIQHLVTLTGELRPPVELVPALSWTNLGVRDFSSFSMPQVQQFLAVCEAALAKNEAVAVHCKAGMGRTGTMLACYLVRFEGARPDEAIERVRAARPGSIETAEQERTVTEYYQFLQSLTNNSI